MMGVIVEYAYTRDAVVTSDNVERLLPAADQVHNIKGSIHKHSMQRCKNIGTHPVTSSFKPDSLTD